MKSTLVIAAAIALAIPAAAFADPGKGNKGGGHSASASKSHSSASKHSGLHKNGAQKSRARDDHRGHSAMANGAWTPPGLAKKPHGMPPGQAKKRWSEGERLPDQYYSQSRYAVADPSRYNLAPAPYGSRWVQVGDNYYLTRTDTGIVNQIVSALLR